MTNDANSERIRDAVGSMLHEQPRSVMPITNSFGGANTTYIAEMLERTVIVRTNLDPAMFHATARNIAALRTIGLPVPNVLAYRSSGPEFSGAVIILENIPGRDLRYELASMTREQMTALAEKMVGYQRAVNRLAAGSGYGYAGIGERAPHSTWRSVIRASREFPAEDEPLRAWRDRIGLLCDRHADYLMRILPVCFLDDITVKNVIMRGGELQGLIDFDCVCYGDPLWWISLTSVGTVSDIGVGELFYADELTRLWKLSGEESCVLAMYCAQMGAEFYSRCAATETDAWRVRMRTAIGAWLLAAS